MIVGLDGRKIQRPADLGVALERRAAGDVVAVKLIRTRIEAGIPVREGREVEVKLVARNAEDGR